MFWALLVGPPLYVGVLVGSGPVLVCFWVLLFALFLRWRNASLAGRFACRRFLFVVFVVVCWFDRFA